MRIRHARIAAGTMVAVCVVLAAASSAQASPVSSTASAQPAAGTGVTATIPAGDYPVGVAVDEHTDTVYVTNEFSNTVSVISGRTNAVIATVPVVPSRSAAR